MLTILLHSSKTMRQGTNDVPTQQVPILLAQAQTVSDYLKSLNERQLQKSMTLSPKKAAETYELLQQFSLTTPGVPAIDCFLGDIYSGLQAQTFSQADRDYANNHLYILSGLYGVLRALDTIQPYRLEMGYKLPAYPSLYEFWGDAIVKTLPVSDTIINLSAKEYTKAVFPHLKNALGFESTRIISPKFLTVSPKTGEPTFVTVHAKIARGAFARWLIQHRIQDASQLREFNDLGYQFDSKRSTDEEPVFVATQFRGLGLSVRLQ